MKLSEKVRAMIKDIRSSEEALWLIAVANSELYRKALKLSSEDLQCLERSQPSAGMLPDLADLAESGFLRVPIDGEQFALVVTNRCGIEYGDGWEMLIMAVCLSKESANKTAGKGTCMINIVESEWNVKLVKALSE